MQPLQAGKLRQRISIFDIPQGQPDTAGELADPLDAADLSKLIPLGTFWASIEPLGGRELLQAAETLGESTHRVIMRWPGFEVTSEMWIQFGTRMFDITNTSDIEERNRVVVIMCKERD